jgi:hypothetical protein
MREQINSNPVVQAVVVGMLLLAAVFFFMTTMGGGEESAESGAAATETPETAETSAAATLAPAEGVEGVGVTAPTVSPEALAASAPPPPKVVTAAYEADRTVVLLFVRNAGIDDRLVKDALGALTAFPDVATFVVPAERIARYSAITGGVEVNRVPALVVLRPKSLTGSTPTASVQYGFQSPESVAQAVIDAGYKGRTLDYHP